MKEEYISIYSQEEVRLILSVFAGLFFYLFPEERSIRICRTIATVSLLYQK